MARSQESLMRTVHGTGLDRGLCRVELFFI